MAINIPTHHTIIHELPGIIVWPINDNVINGGV